MILSFATKHHIFNGIMICILNRW